MEYLVFAVFGYVSGSVMYSRLLPFLFKQVDITKISDDGNPGAGNVFQHLGISFGLLCLACDILKGAIPVALCLHYLPPQDPLFALVLAAPVLGHAKRGKAIAVSFGVLLGLLPFSGMVLLLIVPFLFFSLILKVNPHAWRVIFSFGCFVAAAHIWVPVPALRFGAWLIGAAVTAKHAIYVKCAHERLRLEWGLKPRRSSRAADD